MFDVLAFDVLVVYHMFDVCFACFAYLACFACLPNEMFDVLAFGVFACLLALLGLL